jgi:hypothetical protein
MTLRWEEYLFDATKRSGPPEESDAGSRGAGHRLGAAAPRKEGLQGGHH